MNNKRGYFLIIGALQILYVFSRIFATRQSCITADPSHLYNSQVHGGQLLSFLYNFKTLSRSLYNERFYTITVCLNKYSTGEMPLGSPYGPHRCQLWPPWMPTFQCRISKRIYQISKILHFFTIIPEFSFVQAWAPTFSVRALFKIKKNFRHQKRKKHLPLKFLRLHYPFLCSKI